jgi:tRNA-dihydrouridine synthase A
MLGRAIYHQPYLLADIDSKVFGIKGIFRTREQVLVDYMTYIKNQLKQGVPIRAMTRHILGLYHGQNNAKFFRRLLSGKTVELSHLDEWLEFTKK